MLLNLLLLVVDLWALGGLVLLLHRFAATLGLAPLMMTVGALLVLLTGPLSLFIRPANGIVFFVTSNVLAPVLLMSVLIIYVTNGSVPARRMILSFVGVGLLQFAILQIYRLHLSLPGSVGIRNLPDVLEATNYRVTLGSFTAFTTDLLVIIIFFQWLKNRFTNVPEGTAVGLALLLGLWTDALVFHIVADIGTPNFALNTPGDFIGKTFSALLLWPPLAYYMTQVAPKLPGYVGAEHRPVFDLLFGGYDALKLALSSTEAALAHSEAERRQRDAYIQEISEQINEALWMVDANSNRVFYVNPAYERIWGRRAAEIYADELFFEKSLHPDDREWVIAGLNKRLAGDYEIEFRIVLPDGAVRWIRDRVFPIYTEDGRVYRLVGISEDITAHKQAERQQLELSLEREKVKLLNDFISETSHDLKNPLTAINMKAYYLAREGNPEQRKVHLAELEHITARMSNMIDDLLTLSRLENVAELSPSLLDLNTLVQEAAAAIKPLAKEKGLELQLELDGPLAVTAKESDLSRVLTNLMDNAVRYTPGGGSITVRTAENQQQAVVSVSDTGIGIPESDQQHIFERFFRADNARREDPSGTGLGLAIVHKIVTRHGGHIEVRSKPGAGTTFAVYLPKAVTT
jgi:PAS domain S-box-containing protein